MDPKATLREMLEALEEVRDPLEVDWAYDIAKDRFYELLEWALKGGTIPTVEVH